LPTGPDRALAETTRQLADEYDRVAWAAQDLGSETEYESYFRRARAAAALAFAHGDEAPDAVYEAAHAFGETDDFADALRAALST
jgi:hypothetical protein